MMGLLPFYKHSVDLLVVVFAVNALVLLPLSVFAQNGAIACGETSCVDCITVGCSWFPTDGGVCYESCAAFPEVSCYSDLFYGRENPQSICDRVPQDEANDSICGVISDCAVCVGTSKRDGQSNCVWYEATNTCGGGACTYTTCGTSMCPVDVGSSPTVSPIPAPIYIEEGPPTLTNVACQLNTTSCAECLLATVNGTAMATSCAWVAGDCVDSCNVVPGVKCYSQQSFPEIDATEICLLEQQDTVDFNVCGAASNCQNCTATLQSDDVTLCLWYEKADSDIEPYCGPANFYTDANNCDLNGVCGISDCNRINNNTIGNDESTTNNSTTEKGPTNNSTTEKGPTNTTTGTSAASYTSIFATVLHVISLFMVIHIPFSFLC